MRTSYVIGVDFGTDSVRAILVNAGNGEELATSIFYYPRWKKQFYCNAAEQQFRQHPLDYIEGLEYTIKDCVSKVDQDVVDNIRGISIDTTGSTPVVVDKAGTPLALLPGFEENPNAMFVLWKDHTAIAEADRINEHAKKYTTNYLEYAGGIYSAEWFWAKMLHVLNEDELVRDAAYSFVEHCDWIPFLLTGGTEVHRLKRITCAAGHKSLWHERWKGLPPNDFFAELDPLLDGFVSRLFIKTYTNDRAAGTISKSWADRLGLNPYVIIGIGAFDCHMGAIGGQIEPYYLSKVMGTSTCDMLVAPVDEIGDRVVNGICGQVKGSILPSMIGMEAGQSAFGDAYAWFRNLLSQPWRAVLDETVVIDRDTKMKLLQESEDRILPLLNELAMKINVDADSELAIDWLNGRRTPDANQELTGAIYGLSLGTDAVSVFRAIAEGTCFGAKAIVERFREQGIPVKGLIGLGGISRKSPFIMQMMADVMNMPIRIHRSEQTCALGAAMCAATAAGIHASIEDAMLAMGQGFDLEYHPNATMVQVYRNRYEKYKTAALFGERQLAKNIETTLENILHVKL